MRRVLILLFSLFFAAEVHAEAPPELPSSVSLELALALFHAHGLDLLIADAHVASAQGDVKSAGAVANPSVSFAIGPAINYAAPAGCVGCQSWAMQWAVTDNGALLDMLTGKRGLRVDTAKYALAAARLDRVDAERVIRGDVKVQYLEIAAAKASVDFAKDVQKSLEQTLAVSKQRYPAVINEADLARIEIQKLQADQLVDAAQLRVKNAQLGLAFLIGHRGTVPDFDVDRGLLKFVVSPALTQATIDQLVDRAIQTRPDLRAAMQRKESAQSALDLAKRRIVPDIALSLAYSQFGNGADAAQPPTAIVGLTIALPLFYQQQGEVKRASADVDTHDVEQQKQLAAIRSEVGQAFASFTTARDILTRMEGSQLERAKKARDVVDFQFKAGSATLIDYLDAERVYIQTNADYLAQLDVYWTSVFRLEQAVGADLR